MAVTSSSESQWVLRALHTAVGIHRGYSHRGYRTLPGPTLQSSNTPPHNKIASAEKVAVERSCRQLLLPKTIPFGVGTVFAKKEI